MIKHIAVGLDGSANAAAAQELGIALAGAHQAVLHGVHVIDATFLEGAFVTDISGAMGFEPFLNLQSQVRATLEELGRAIGACFTERCTAVGVPHEFRLERAGVAAGLAAVARLADLIVVGQRGVNARFHADALGPTAAALLRRSKTPVVVVPEGAGRPRRILAAFDGSAKAVRALHVAAELAKACAAPLVVVTVTNQEERGRARLDEARRYVGPFGLETEFLLRSGDAVEEVLLGVVREGGFDLIAVGAHGHGRIVELVLGSTSEALARLSPVPVLCATV